MISHAARIETLTGRKIIQVRRLAGGMIGDVFRVQFQTGDDLVAKVSTDDEATLDIEGQMLGYLQEHSTLPVPEVIHSEAQLLLLSYIANDGNFSSSAERHAGNLIAALHSIHAEQVGLSFDTLIGPLHQPNPQMSSWVDFFREHRLLYMADMAHASGHLPTQTRHQLDAVAAKLDTLITEPAHPTLIHGDLWGGNVLIKAGQIAAFIDPAIYYGHPEIELAYSTLFGTFWSTFFDAYQEHHPLEPGFFKVRRDVYNLYPLLVHTRLFGGSYARQIAEIVKRFV